MEELENTYIENGIILRLVKSNYVHNNAVYFGLIIDETKELFSDITINLHYSSKRIIEISNDFRQFCSKALVESVLQDLTICYLFDDESGYCLYPVMTLKEKYIE